MESSFLFARGLTVPASNERARKVDAECVDLHDDEQVHVPENDNGKVVKHVRGLLGLRVLKEIARVDQHGGEAGRQTEHHRAHVVEAKQLETVLAQRCIASQRRH